MGFVTRSEGRSSVGFSAYISGSCAVDARTGVAYNFSHKNEVVAARVLTPEGAPESMEDRTQLWSQVELFEDQLATLRFRGDDEKSMSAREKFLNSTQTAQTVMGAIPLELTRAQVELCVEEFLKQRFVSRALVVDYAIHDNEGNPHFHALVTRRPLIDGAFSPRKDREIVSLSEHNVTRKLWEVVVNSHLEKAGHDVRIDSRSHADRNGYFLATEHEGWHAQKLAAEGKYASAIARNDEVRRHNIKIMVERPEALIEELATKRATFTQHHVEGEIMRRIGGDVRLISLLDGALRGIETSLSPANVNSDDPMRSPKELAVDLAKRLLSNHELVTVVGENPDRETVFTTRNYQSQESEVLRAAETLHTTTNKVVHEDSIARAVSEREREMGATLSEEQRHAITHLCSGPNLRILNGRAGTGKTTLLKAVASAYQDAGYEVMGTSFQGKAVEIMAREIDVPCQTLHSLMDRWTRADALKAKLASGQMWGRPYIHGVSELKRLETSRLHEKQVIIVDEANMIGQSLWQPFLKEAAIRGAKVLVVQDPSQIKSRDPGDVGRMLAERYGCAETSQVMRQRVEWQQDSSVALNDHRIRDGLTPYYDKGHLHWREGNDELTAQVVSDYLKGSSSNQMVLAYTNLEVHNLNQSIRAALKETGQLSEKSHKIEGIDYAIGDRIRFMQNDHKERFMRTQHTSLWDLFKTGDGVKNGTLGTIERISSRKVVVVLDDERRVAFNPQNYAHITHGYALSIHKSEGSTFDRTLVVTNPMMDPNTTLVAMTRHRHDVQVYVDRNHSLDFKQLVEQCSKGRLQDTSHDYQITPQQQPFFDRVRLYKDLAFDAATLREEMESTLGSDKLLREHPSYGAYQQCYDSKRELANEILSNWKDHAPFARLAGLRKDVLEVETGHRAKLLSDKERHVHALVAEYKETSLNARTLWETIQKTHPGAVGSLHPLYLDYESARNARNGMAHALTQESKEARSLLRSENLSWKMFTAHAQAHEVSIAEKMFVDGLSPTNRKAYENVNAYVTARNQAVALYAHIKSQDHARISDSALTGSLQKISASRDILAAHITEDLNAHKPFLARQNIKTDQITTHAHHGQIRNLAHAYLENKDLAQTIAAKDLQEALKGGSDYRILKEMGVNIKQLKSDAGIRNADVRTVKDNVGISNSDVSFNKDGVQLESHDVGFKKISSDPIKSLHSEITSLIDRAQREQNPETKSNLNYELRIKLKELHHDPERMTSIKATNPDLAELVETMISTNRDRGR